MPNQIAAAALGKADIEANAADIPIVPHRWLLPLGLLLGSARFRIVNHAPASSNKQDDRLNHARRP
jgi:hypothetical protein